MKRNKKLNIALSILILCFSLHPLITILDKNDANISKINFESIHSSAIYYDIVINDFFIALTPPVCLLIGESPVAP